MPEQARLRASSSHFWTAIRSPVHFSIAFLLSPSYHCALIPWHLALPTMLQRLEG